MVRKAVFEDVEAIRSLVEGFSSTGEMLPRTTEEITRFLRDFFVCEEGGEVVGVSALSLAWKDMGEVRSLAVKKGFEKRGVGSALVAACLDEARELGLSRVFALTYVPGFFERFGFGVVAKEELPQKIWGDCVKCAKFPACDETAVILELEEAKKTGTG